MTYVLNKDEVKEEFFKIKKIGHYDVNVTEYINRDKMFEHAFNSLKPHILDWIENIEDPQQVKNMKADKEHALHHFLAKRGFPTGYTDDVGVEVIGDEMLEYHGLTVDEYIQKTLNRGDNVFERLYGEVIMEFIDLQDDDIYEFMNKNDLLKEYEKSPISEHSDIAEKWIDKLMYESEVVHNGILIAASRIISEYTNTKLLVGGE